MGRVALVTGGTRGIGESICIKLKLKGYNVVANYGSSDRVAQYFTEKTGIPAYRFDVSDTESVIDGIGQIEAEHGSIDILINNAGITRDGTLHKMPAENWDTVISTNLNSCFNTVRAVLKGMRKRQFGRIVNISSVNGQMGQYGQANYTAAKAGVIGFSKAVAQENSGRGITVNTIAPGYVDTDMVRAVPEDVLQKIISTIPVGRLGKPEDISRAVLFLIDDDADFITGTTVSVNGGQYML